MSQIDQLSIKIEADATAASNGIDALSNSLSKLRNSVKGGLGLDAVSSAISSLGTALAGIDQTKITTLTSLTQALTKLSKVNGGNLHTIAGGLDKIATSASSVQTQDADNLEKLALSAQSLNALNSVSIPQDLAQRIEDLALVASYITPAQTANLTGFVAGMQSLNQLSTVTIPMDFATRLESVANAANTINGITDFSAFEKLATSLQPLTQLTDTGGLGKFINALGRLPGIMNKLTGQVLTQFETAMQRIAAALQPIANLSVQGAAGIQQLIQMMQQIIRLGGRIGQNTNNNVTSFLRSSLLLRVITRYMSMASNAIASWLKNTNSYIEDLNLFTASMGKYASEAQRYAETVADVMGIDPAQWMRNQGVFMTLAEGFGVASDRAYTMSKNLTQLGYDLSSFFNISVSDAMTKLQSGLSGELEPLRRLGYDLSQARLKAIALELGITKTFNTMSQAEKSQLRYYAIMTQVTKAQGDMSRTLEAPANQLRILQAQVTQVARALGSIFIPLLNKTLPYVIALAKAVRKLAEQIASVFGFTLPEVDYSSITNVVGAGDEATDALTGANSAAEKLNETLAGFDELNVIASEKSNGSGSGSSAGGSGSDLGFDLPEYDFLGDAVSATIDEIEAKITPMITGLLGNLDLLLGSVVGISLAFKAWGSDENFKTVLSQIRNVGTAVASIVITAALSYHFTNDYVNSDKWYNVWPLIKNMLTTALGAYIAGNSIKKVWGSTAGLYTAGATVAISAAVQLGVTAVKAANDGLNWNTAISSLVTVLTGAAAGSLFSIAAGGTLATGAAVGAIVTIGAVAVTLTVAYIYWKTHKSDITWGDLTIDGEDISTYVSGHFFNNLSVTATVDAIDLVVTDAATARTNLSNALTSFNDPLKRVVLGIDDAETLKNMKESLFGDDVNNPSADSLMGQLLSTIRASANVIEVGIQLGFVEEDKDPNNPTGADQTSALVSRINERTTSLIMSEGAELAKLYEEGLTGKLSEDKQALIQEIGLWFSEISQAVVDGQMRAEIEMWANVHLKDLDSGSVSSVIEEYRDEYDNVYSYYQQMAQQVLAEFNTQETLALATYNRLVAKNADPAEIAAAWADYQAIAAKHQQYLDGMSEMLSSQTNTALKPVRERMAAELAELYSGLLPDLSEEGATTAAEMVRSAVESGESSFYEAMSRMSYWLIAASGKGKQTDTTNFANYAYGTGTAYEVLGDEIHTIWYKALVEAFGGDQDKVNALFAESGMDIPGGIETGISTAQPELNSAVEGAITEAAASADVSAYTELGRSASNAFTSGLNMYSNQHRMMSLGISPKVYRGYATGGFPTQGEMFYASEAGPELVGRIGRRTAVANTDQIVQGISYGVSNANSEQTSLLREQNSLLRSLLRKESKVEITPSVGFGRVAAKSADLYNKAYG